MDAEHADLLISRIVGAEADAGDWRQFSALAADDPALWSDLASAQRDHAELVQLVSAAGAVAERVDAAGWRAAEPWTSLRLATIASWSGWAVAAMVAVAAIVAGGRFGDGGPPAPNSAAPVAAAPVSVDDAFRAYLDLGRRSGRVVGEVPTRYLLTSRPREAGEGYDVVYLRGVLERTVVPDLYRFEGQTDQGQPTLVRWDDMPGSTM